MTVKRLSATSFSWAKTTAGLFASADARVTLKTLRASSGSRAGVDPSGELAVCPQPSESLNGADHPRHPNSPVPRPSVQPGLPGRGALLDPGIQAAGRVAPGAEVPHRICTSVTRVLPGTIIRRPRAARMATARWHTRPSSPSGAHAPTLSAEARRGRGAGASRRQDPCNRNASAVRQLGTNLNLPSMAPSANQVMSASASSALPYLGRPFSCFPCTAASTSRRYATCAVSSMISARYWALMSDAPTPIVP